MFLPLVLAALTLSPEVPVSTATEMNASGRQSDPAIASNGTEFFAAWVHDNQGHAKGRDVVGSRMTSEGAVLDRGNGILLRPSEVADTDPEVVWNGSTYAVMSAVGPEPWAYGARIVEVSAAGEVLGDRDVVRNRYITNVDLAWNGSVYLAVWREYYGGKARGRILDRAFAPISEELVIGDNALDVSVASNGTGFVAAWHTQSSTFVNTITSAGVVSAPVTVGANATSIDVASNGVSYAVFLGGLEILALDASGAVTHMRSMPPGVEAAMAWNGVRWVAAWTAAGRIQVAELDASLQFVRAPERLTAQESLQAEPAIAANGANTIVLFRERSLVHSDIRSARLGHPTSTSLVAWGLPHQFPAAAAWSHSRLGVLWYEGDWGDDALRFGLFSNEGTLLTEEGTLLAAASQAQLASNGTIFAVAAIRGIRVEVEFLGSDGARLGGPIIIGEGSDPRIESDGRDFYVAWRTESESVHVRHVRIDGSLGPVHELPRVLAGASITRRPVDIVWTGSEAVVVTVERTEARIVTYAAASTSISAAGVVSTPVTITQRTAFYMTVNIRAEHDGQHVVYIWDDIEPGIVIQKGVNGEKVVDTSVTSLSDARWDGRQLVMLTGQGVRRGNDVVTLTDRSILIHNVAPVLAVAPGRRAIVYHRTVHLHPALLDQIVDRTFVRFIDVATKQRAVRK